MKNSKKDLLFPDVRTDSAVDFRLFCFPFAGGSSFTYRLWKNRLPVWLDVCPANLPGRAMRMGEPGFTSLTALTEDIAEKIRPYTDRPFALFGYSMGAIIGFELARRLQREGIVPERLFVAASPPPHLTAREPIIYDLPPDEFKAELFKLAGTPREVLENEELFDLMEPLLRADFEMIETYRYLPDAPLAAPIFAFGGDADAEVSESELAAWEDHTEGGFDYRIYGGNHFFINERADEIVSTIEKILAAMRR